MRPFIYTGKRLKHKKEAAMGKFSPPKPKPFTPPPPPEPLEDPNAKADEEAAAEADRLRRGRVKTILTSGQGLEEDSNEDIKKRKTVLGG